MAITYSTAVKTARMTAVRDQIDGGAGAGKIKIRDSGNVVLATIVLGDPSGTVTNDVLTLSGFPRSDTSADAAGTAANAIITDSSDVTVVSGLSVGTSASDIILDNLNIALGQTVTLNSATITHAA
jgi:hypothetical protein